MEAGGDPWREIAVSQRADAAGGSEEETLRGPLLGPARQAYERDLVGGRIEATEEAEVLPQVGPRLEAASEAARTELGEGSGAAISSLARVAGLATPAIACTGRGLVRGSEQLIAGIERMGQLNRED